MSKCKLHIVIFLALFIAGCNPQPEAKQLLQQASRLVDAYPDSAMHLIDSIFYPDRSLNRKQYMEFIVTQVQAKYKTHRPVTEDTLIFTAKDYFTKHNNDLSQTALAWFYSGCVYREQQRYDEAMQHYKEAEQYASKTDNVDLKVLIKYNMGDLLTGEGLHRQALTYYSESAEIYSRSFGEMYKNQATCFAAMGRMYLLLKQSDSAFLYFQKGLDIAENSGDDNLQRLLAQNLSVMYKELKEYEKSEFYLRQSFELNQDSTALPRYYLNLAGVYSGMNRPDSTTYYTEKLEESLHLSNDNTFKQSAYNFLSNYKKNQGDYPAALNYKEKRELILTEMIHESRDKSVYDIQQKYDFGQQQNHYNQMLIARQWWIILFLILILSGGVSFTAYTIFRNHKFREVHQRMDTLNQMNEKLMTLLFEKDKYLTERSEKLQEAILLQFDVAKKILLLKSRNSQTKDRGVNPDNLLIRDINRILYKQTDIQDEWDAMLSVIERARPGLSAKMRESFPTLNEQEFRVAMLAYADFKVDETGIILNLKPNSVQSIRTSLRKKINALPNESISDFLRMILG